jgi:hypothetical protein
VAGEYIIGISDRRLSEVLLHDLFHRLIFDATELQPILSELFHGMCQDIHATIGVQPKMGGKIESDQAGYL